MKKLMIAFCMIMLAISASAQYNPSFRFGLKGGANLSNINGSNDLSLTSGGTAFDFKDNSDRSAGFVGGMFFRFGRGLYMQPEILLSQKGGQFNVFKDGVKNEDDKVDIRFSNLDVPLLFGFRLARFFRVNVGPMASMNLSKYGKIRDSFDEIAGENSNGEFANRLSFGYQAGTGLDFGRLSLDVRYEGNLSEVARINFNNATTAAQFGKKSNLFQATLGVAIF
jgi:hypothetical protein